jgi:hypothetical protein
MLQKGLFAESTEYYQAGLDLLPAGDRRRGWVPGAIKTNDSLMDMEIRIPLILAGTETAPASQLLDMAVAWAIFKRHYATAAFLFQKAFVADPRLGQSRGQRYTGACAAALGGCGRGEDAASFSADQRTTLRNQARAWLEADLDLGRRMLLAANMEKKLAALDRLTQWRNDPYLAGVREPEALARLPKEESQSWQQFWDDLPKMAETRHVGTLTVEERIRAHEVSMAQGTTYVIDLESNAFDAFLRLDDSQDTKLAENDDANPNTLNARVIFTPKESGTYRVIASSFQNQGIGAYLVRIREIAGKAQP